MPHSSETAPSACAKPVCCIRERRTAGRPARMRKVLRRTRLREASMLGRVGLGQPQEGLQLQLVRGKPSRGRQQQIGHLGV
jgi:hypothetical protein